MLNIYTPTDQEEYWLSQTDFDDYATTRSMEEWMYLPNRVAMLEVREFGETTHQLLGELVGLANHVIVIIHELINDAWITKFDRPSVTFFVSGILNYKTKHAAVYFYPYFLTSTVAFYRAHPEILAQLTKTLPTLRYDVLLGRRKAHRDQVYAAFDQQFNVVKYFPSAADQDIRYYTNQQFEWPSVLSLPDAPITMTAQEVRASDTIVSLSQIIPVDIYNRTCYSFIAETDVCNQYSFFTEKIVKPMLARRLFVVATGQHYLCNLRKLGFRTFDGIVDETYDSIEDVNIRIDTACDAANSLIHVDKELLAEITEHNYQHLMSTDWNGQMIQQLQKVLDGIQ
jgi:hypothetical protein